MRESCPSAGLGIIFSGQCGTECLFRRPKFYKRVKPGTGSSRKATDLLNLDYCSREWDCLADSLIRAFASIVETDARPNERGGLRKDYAYLFERFFYYLEDSSTDEQGIVVFDELEKSKSHLLIEQMHRYFEQTAVGRHRASRIIPEPFFVHSDLTTGVQVADLLACVISWGFRMTAMTKPVREELSPFADQIANFALPGRAQAPSQPSIRDLELCAHHRPADAGRTRRQPMKKQKRQ